MFTGCFKPLAGAALLEPPAPPELPAGPEPPAPSLASPAAPQTANAAPEPEPQAAADTLMKDIGDIFDD